MLGGDAELGYSFRLLLVKDGAERELYRLPFFCLNGHLAEGYQSTQQFRSSCVAPVIPMRNPLAFSPARGFRFSKSVISVGNELG